MTADTYSFDLPQKRFLLEGVKQILIYTANLNFQCYML